MTKNNDTDLITTPTDWEFRCMRTNASAGVPLTSRQSLILEGYPQDKKDAIRKAIAKGLEAKRRK